MPDMLQNTSWFWIAVIIIVLVFTGVLIAMYAEHEDIRGGKESSAKPCQFETVRGADRLARNPPPTQQPLSYYFSDTGNAASKAGD